MKKMMTGASDAENVVPYKLTISIIITFGASDAMQMAHYKLTIIIWIQHLPKIIIIS